MILHPCHRRHRPDAACAIAPSALCHKCNAVTATVYLPFQTGDIGNCCAVCRTCRKGRPFVTRREFQMTLTPAGAEGAYAIQHLP